MKLPQQGGPQPPENETSDQGLTEMRNKRFVSGLMGMAAVCLCLLMGLASPSGAAEHRVIIANFAFSPASLTIKAGDTVLFVNRDDVPHTATRAAKGAFDTESLSQGRNMKITFANPGEYTYNCSIHPSMEGRIVVQK